METDNKLILVSRWDPKDNFIDMKQKVEIIFFSSESETESECISEMHVKIYKIKNKFVTTIKN